jgi:hypothetical protein
MIYDLWSKISADPKVPEAKAFLAFLLGHRSP